MADDFDPALRFAARLIPRVSMSARLSRALKRPVIAVSPLTGAGLPALLEALASRFPASEAAAPIWHPADEI